MGTSCTAFCWGNSTSKKEANTMAEEFADYLKGLGAFYAAFLLPAAIYSYFEYQDDKVIRKIKNNDEEYKNAKSWKEKAKIGKSIDREYHTTKSLKKKWGRRGIAMASCLGCCCVACVYFRRFFASIAETL